MAKEYYEFDLTPGERRRKEWEKATELKGAAKAAHIWRYYKFHIMIAVLLLAACIFAAHQAYTAQYHNVLYVGIVNDPSVDSEGMAEDMKKLISDDDRFAVVECDDTMTFTEDGKQAMNDNVRLMTYITLGDIDVVLCDDTVYDHIGAEYLDSTGTYTVSKENPVLSKYGIDEYDSWKLCLVKGAKNSDNGKRYIKHILEAEE